MPQCSGDSLTMERTLYASSTAHELFVTGTSKPLVLCTAFEWCTWTGYSHFTANSFKHMISACTCVQLFLTNKSPFLNKREWEVDIWKTKRMWVFSIITILVILNYTFSKINWERRHMGFWTMAKSSGYGIILLTTNTKNHESPVKTSKQTPEYCQPCKFHPHHKWDNYSQEISRMRLTKPNHVTCYIYKFMHKQWYNSATHLILLFTHVFGWMHTSYCACVHCTQTLVVKLLM